MSQTNNETKASRTYDGAVILIGSILLIFVLVSAVYLLSVAVHDAPVVTSIFGILFVLFCIATVLGFSSLARWSISQNAQVHTQVAASVGAALGQALSQYHAPQLPAPTVIAEPARSQVVDIRRQFSNGLPPGVSGARVSDGQSEYYASTDSLIAALTLLAEGKDPTRSNFRDKGIYSSTETAGAVNLLASLGYVSPVVQGAPAEWASGVAPSSVGAIADHLRQYVPALPVFQAVYAEQAAPGKSGRQQAGGGRGRK